MFGFRDEFAKVFVTCNSNPTTMQLLRLTALGCLVGVGASAKPQSEPHKNHIVSTLVDDDGPQLYCPTAIDLNVDSGEHVTLDSVSEHAHDEFFFLVCWLVCAIVTLHCVHWCRRVRPADRPTDTGLPWLDDRRRRARQFKDVLESPRRLH